MTGKLRLDSLAPTVLHALLLLSCIWAIPGRAQDNIRLQEIATPCLACHSLAPDGVTHVGPSLAGIANRALGGNQNYTYSEAFVEKSAKGLIWDRKTLDRFLEDPRVMVEGTAMSFSGVPAEEDRAILIEWLFSDPADKSEDLINANYNHVPAVMEILDAPADAEYGEYLAGECLTCHQPGDSGGRVPPIQNLTPDYFIHALLEYKNGARSNRVMQNITGALGVEELAALSVVFSPR